MAEVAIPIAVLGVMYIISNKTNKKEGFTNSSTSKLNVAPTIRNYPEDKKRDLLNKTNVQTYQGYKNSSENYYQPDGYKKALKNNVQKLGQFKSINGNVITTKDMKHNNMVPFFGSKITQQGAHQGYEGLLDIYTGRGSQHQKKKSIGPMFKPQANMHHIHGTPVSTDFYQERMRGTLTTKMNNVKPWQEIQVGPGLGKGYSSEGSGGFNAGMESREAHLPKSIDELRVSTNPKVTYGGQMLGAFVGKGSCMPANSATHGKLAKNRPDTSFSHCGGERWFVTTGAAGQAPKIRSDIILPLTNAATTTKEYFGTGKDREGSGPYQPGHYRGPHKQQLCGPDLGTASVPNAWSATNKDYGKSGYHAGANSRTLTGDRTEMGIVSGVVSALTAPLMDLLRPSRKQNVIGNMRPTGNVQGKYGVQNEPVWNPNDAPAPTIREQTENTPHIMMGGGRENRDGYMTTQYNPTAQQRDNTTHNKYITGSGALPGTTGPRIYNSDYNANTNPNKEVVAKVDRFNIGNQSLGGRNQNVTNLRNTACRPDEMHLNMPKYSADMQTHGALSGKHTRERAVNCQRNSPAMVQAFNQNPYTHSLHSNA
ncbi:MAG: hypothetical protein CL678_06140 [Bdellovibrionaceae bacterium]|nr:hypothetical protein [Pseudobdellovibrionaceae bacterium]|tara:strand:- start:605 stop:2389 length:1785 start_codon:yes stop_codon:yes gene_type:complete